MLLDKITSRATKLSSLFLLIIVFFIPIWIKIALLFIPLLLLSWLFERKWQILVIEIKRNRFAQLLILFWILHLVGVLYSTNWKYGLNDVQQKLSFVFFPIFLLTAYTYDKLTTSKILKIFLVGSVISGLVCISNALYHSISITSKQLIFNPIPFDAEYENYFKYTRFSFLYHPSYLAMFFTFSIAILFKFIKERKNDVFYVLLFSFGIIFFSILILFLSPRAGIVALFSTIIIGLIWLLTDRIKWVLRAGFIGIFGVLAFILFLSINKDSSFVKKMNEEIFYNLNPRKSQFSHNYDMRFYLWQCIPDVMSKNLVFGYGTGDFHVALNEQYDKHNLVSAAQNEYNAHNQFFECLVGLGLVGFVVMLMLILYPMYFLLKKDTDFIKILFFVIISINFLAESMLSRIAGILFFALFYCLFFCFKQKKIDN